MPLRQYNCSSIFCLFYCARHRSFDRLEMWFRAYPSPRALHPGPYAVVTDCRRTKGRRKIVPNRPYARAAAKLFRDALEPAHIRLKRIRYGDRAIGILVVLQDRDQRPPDGKARTVQRVDRSLHLAVAAAVARV